MTSTAAEVGCTADQMIRALIFEEMISVAITTSNITARMRPTSSQ
jgi:hypothetical protein